MPAESVIASAALGLDRLLRRGAAQLDEPIELDARECVAVDVLEQAASSGRGQAGRSSSRNPYKEGTVLRYTEGNTIRKVSAAVAALGAVGVLAPAASAADFKPVSDKDVAPSSLGNVCDYHTGFAPTDAVAITVVQNQWESRTTVGPAGLKTTEGQVMAGGALVLTFSHVDQNGVVIKSVTEDVSGSTAISTQAQQPNHSFFEGHDRNWLSFGPTGRRLTGEPGLVFTDLGSHATVESFGKSPAFAVNATITGGSVDGCQLLAGP